MMKTTYEQFMKQVDAIIASRLGGMTSMNLDDTVFTYDRFRDECSPEEVADEIMENDDIARHWFEEEL